MLRSIVTLPQTPLDLTIDPVTTDLYVSTRSGLLTIHDLTGQATVKPLGVLHDAFVGIAMSGDGQRVYAADLNDGISVPGVLPLPHPT